MKLSRYIHIEDNGNEKILYHTIEHSVITLPNECLNNNEIISESLDEESIEALRDMGYFSEFDDDILSNIHHYFLNPKKLFISVELNLTCNLRCPYCYQGEKKQGLISDEAIENLIRYYNLVYDKSPFEDLYLKVLGGEPTLVWKKFELLYNGTLMFCKNNDIKFHLLIDTNGTLIDNILQLDHYDSLLLTVPLTFKDCHDSVRFDAKGNGTYDIIIDNLNTIKTQKKDTKIVIRYNVDDKNIKYFEDFVCDVSKRLCFKGLISLNYTAELNGEDEFKNKLSYRDFVDWCSFEAIDILVKYDMPITVSPIISIEECQYRDMYSLKLFSDGTIGSCAMNFFDKKREFISNIVTNFDISEFVTNKNNQSLITKEDCKKCRYLFVCGGTNDLPCLKALDSNLCRDKIFNVNLKKFLSQYLKYQEEKNDLFVVFEDGESYR